MIIIVSAKKWIYYKVKHTLIIFTMSTCRQNNEQPESSSDKSREHEPWNGTIKFILC